MNIFGFGKQVEIVATDDAEIETLKTEFMGMADVVINSLANKLHFAAMERVASGGTVPAQIVTALEDHFGKGYADFGKAPSADNSASQYYCNHDVVSDHQGAIPICLD